MRPSIAWQDPARPPGAVGVGFPPKAFVRRVGDGLQDGCIKVGPHESVRPLRRSLSPPDLTSLRLTIRGWGVSPAETK